MRRRYSEDADTLRLLFQFARESAKEGLSLRELVLLNFLVKQQPDGEAPFSVVQEKCQFSASQTTRAGDGLIKGDLIVRFEDDDRRKTRLKVTAKGRNVFERILQAAHLDE